MNNIQFVTQKEHRDIHLHDDQKIYEAEQRDKALTALHTIQDICKRTPGCSKCQFSVGLCCLISQTETIPRDWKIGNFENGKLLK